MISIAMIPIVLFFAWLWLYWDTEIKPNKKAPTVVIYGEGLWPCEFNQNKWPDLPDRSWVKMRGKVHTGF